MADRTSASVFGKIFELLAKKPTKEHKAIAKEIWPFHREYDFNEYQMECDDALIVLGLADVIKTDDGDEIIYADFNGDL